MNIAPFKLERYFARYEFVAPYLLCPSDCEALSLEDVLAFEPDAREKLSELRLGYVEAAGSPAVRSAVAATFARVSADDVLLHAGSSEAIFTFMTCALTAGDHVVVQHPCYQSHYEVAKSIGCDVTFWTGDEARGWALDVEVLKRALRPNTKAVMLTAPHNPTGYLMAHATFQDIIDVLRERGIMLFSDEIFRFLEQDAGDRLPAAADAYGRAVSVGGLSKTYGLPGVRVGWAATRDRELLARMASVKDYLSLCNGAADEFLAGIALRNRERLHRRSLDFVVANLQLLDEFFERNHDVFQWHRPRAGTVGLVRYRGAEGAAAFCDRVVNQSGVLLLPSAELEFGDAHFRVGFGRRAMPEVLRRFEDFLSSSGALRASG
jgi:aspartate/methionine/tyrosine aminotransferase